MTSFVHGVRDTIVRHQLLHAQDRVLAGVSGGADSTALLLALRELGYDLAVAHLNHGLRGAESDADEQFVKELAHELGVPCFTRTVAIRSEGGNLEAAGREARRRFFQDIALNHEFTKIALAHNREDRAETFLFHLVRGAGSEGLVSMAPAAGNIVRPLIETSRESIEAFLASTCRSWRTDRTNSDMSFSRNKIRHEVLPLLASLFNERLIDSLSRTVTLLHDEDRWMREMTENWLKDHGGAGLPVDALGELPAAFARRLIREMLRQDGRPLTDLTFEHVEAVRGLLEDGKSGKSISLPGGVVAAREFNRLVLKNAGEQVVEFDYELPIPGTIRIPELGRVFRAVVDPGNITSESPLRVLVDGGGLGSCVKIRNWKPGDYYKPAGWPAGKVKKLFQRARVPRSQRSRWPILATGSKIVWVASFPVSREFVPSASSKKIVAFETLER